MIIITDAHVSEANGNHTDFFRMLEALEKNDQDLIFLGDIFDLWIALPRYEEDVHRDFLAWCRHQKKFRRIGYMEGNHEYYLADERDRDFTWCSQAPWRQDDKGILYVHGDQINRKDRNYLGFRKLAKSRISKFLVRVLPFGPLVVASIKKGMKKTNINFRRHLPRDEIKAFAETMFATGVDIIFVGHFHRQFRYGNPQSRALYVLPDWFGTQKVTVYQRESKEIVSTHWEDLETVFRPYPRIDPPD